MASVNCDAQRARYQAYWRDYPTGSVVLGGNSETKYNPAGDSCCTTRMYMVIVKMLKFDEPPPRPTARTVDLADLLGLLAQFAAPLAPLFWCVMAFLYRVEFRLDRLEGFFLRSIAKQLLAGAKAGGAGAGDEDEKKKADPDARPYAFTALFTSYLAGDPTMRKNSNFEFRRNLYMLEVGVQVVVAIPIIMLIVFGFVAVECVRIPEEGVGRMERRKNRSVGFAVLMVVIPALMTWLAVFTWRNHGWRMTQDVKQLLGSALALVFVFLVLCVFMDPRVFEGGEPISIFAVTAVFLTFNIIPMIPISFIMDPELSKSAKQLTAVVSKNKKLAGVKEKLKGLGSMGLRMKLMNAEHRGKKNVEEDKRLALAAKEEAANAAQDAAKEGGKMGWLKGKLGKWAKLPPFLRGMRSNRTGGVDHSTIASLVGDAYTINPRIAALKYGDITEGAFVGGGERERHKMLFKLYLAALAILTGMVFVLGYAKRPENVSATNGVGVAAAVIFFDSCVYLNDRGTTDWGPSFTVVIMILVRMSLAAFSGRLYLIGISGAYLIMGIACAYDVVNVRYKTMSVFDVGAIAFFGTDKEEGSEGGGPQSHEDDMSGSPEFILGYMTFFFMTFLLLTIFSTTFDIVTIDIFGSTWPVWVFGIAAILIVIIVTLGATTVRTFHLEAKHLLRSDKFLFAKEFRTPYMFAAMTWLAMVCSATIFWLSTASSVFIIVALFAPPIIGPGVMAYNNWVSNDYMLMPSWSHPELRIQEHEKAEEADEEDDADEPHSQLDGALAIAAGKGADSALPSKPAGGEPSQSPTKARAKKKKKAIGGGGAGFTLPPLVKTLGAPSKPIKMPALPVRGLFQSGGEQGGGGGGLLGKFKALQPGAGGGGGSAGAKPGGGGGGGMSMAGLLNKSGGGAGGGASSVLGKLGGGHVGMMDKRAAELKDMSLWIDDEKDWDPKMMLGFVAFFRGKLSKTDYKTAALLICMFLNIVFLGLALMVFENPWWLGALFWVCSITLITSLMPLIKYFQVYMWTFDMQLSMLIAVCLWVFGVWGFNDTVLSVAPDGTMSLLLGLITIGYPVVLLFSCTMYEIHDSGWGDIADMRWQRYSLGFCFLFFFAFNFVMYVWVGIVVGLTVTLVLLIFCLGAVYANAWMDHDYWLPVSYSKWGETMMLSGFFGGLVFAYFGFELIWSITVSFWCIIARHGIQALALVLKRPGHAPIYVSKYVFPVYMYNPSSNDITDESSAVMHLYLCMGAILAWGVACVIFIDPLDVGVAIVSMILIAIVSTTGWLLAHTPLELGKAAKCVDAGVLRFAGAEARKTFNSRRQPLTIRCPEVDEAIKAERKAKSMMDRYSTDPSKKKKKPKGLDQPEDDSALDVPGSVTCIEAAEQIEDNSLALWFGSLSDYYDGNMRRDRPAMAHDVFFEALGKGRGPFGWVGLWGLPYKAFAFLREKYHKEFGKKDYHAMAEETDIIDHDEEDDLIGMEMQDEDEEAKKAEAEAAASAVAEPLFDVLPVYMRLTKLDRALEREYHDEIRCIVHFQVLTLVACLSRLEKEKVLFQRFLRENRFKLLANGVKPPDDIFASSSHASIDIQLVANWLQRLTPEQKERFQQLKGRFSQEMDEREHLQDMDDAKMVSDAEALALVRRQREWEQCNLRFQVFEARRKRREEAGGGKTPGDEGKADEGKKKGKMKKKKKGEKNKAAEETEDPEDIINAKENLDEITQGWSCHPSTDEGRSSQFHDADFPHDERSIGACAGGTLVQGWKAAPAINQNACLFEGGTDPDDVFQGVLHDAWLLSAIQIVAASGGVGDADVDEAVDNIFVSKSTSMNGAYAVRFWKNAQWETVIVDDYFPVLEARYNLSKCAGAAFSYTNNFEELWVPLIEKAYAKYYGGYDKIEQGFTHMALKDLTGCESESIPLGRATRGSNKMLLWEKLRKYIKNEYMMGVGSITSDTADKEVLDSGIVFGATYVIYEVVNVDGYKLIKLRNPPGDHGEWQGDWSDQSETWNRRLKKKLGWTDEEDGCFWMSYDDFCTIFRTLYVCRYYDPQKWKLNRFHGAWEGDTAAGLPHDLNRECKIENNPQFALFVDRPTDFFMKLVQVDEDGVAKGDALPSSLFVVATPSHLRNRSVRVRKLTTVNTVAHTGEEVHREREVVLYTTLDPGGYTLLCAPYNEKMEGPFQLDVWSNFPVRLQQIWPPTWKEGERDEDGNVITLKDKLKRKAKEKAAQAAQLALDAAAKAEKAAHKAKIDLKNKAAEKGLGGGATEADHAALGAKELEEAEAAEEKEEARRQEYMAKQEELEAWRKEWDPAKEAHYYFNKKTGMSSFEMPEGFVDKKAEKKKRRESKAADSDAMEARMNQRAGVGINADPGKKKKKKKKG
jgi:hypothetical protein